jgi:hypothetical protein
MFQINNNLNARCLCSIGRPVVIYYNSCLRLRTMNRKRRWKKAREKNFWIRIFFRPMQCSRPYRHYGQHGADFVADVGHGIGPWNIFRRISGRVGRTRRPRRQRAVQRRLPLQRQQLLWTEELRLLANRAKDSARTLRLFLCWFEIGGKKREREREIF